MKVDIIIGGFQKCGTTALHSFLSKHPKVIGSNPKEVDYFNFDVKFNKGVDYYHSHFDHKPKFSKLRGYKYMEASPSYFTELNKGKTPERIYEYNKKVKLICLVRNPVDRAFSAWNMYKKRYETGEGNWWDKWMIKRNGKIPDNIIRRSKEEFDNFDLFISNEINAINERKKIECKVLDLGFYSKGILAYRKYFTENLLILKNETLNLNTSEELMKIANFLALEDFDWNVFQNEKIFEGNYSGSPDVSTINLLDDFYLESNKKLFELTGVNYLSK